MAFLRLFSSFIRIVRSECTLFLHFNSGFSQWLSQLYFCRTPYTHTLVFPLQISLVVRNGSLSVQQLSRSLVSCSQLNFVSVFSNFCRCIHVIHSLLAHRTLGASDFTRTAHITDLINLLAQLSFSTGLYTYSTTLARSFAVCLLNLYFSALPLTYASSLSFVHFSPCFDGTASYASSLVYTTDQSGFDSVFLSSTVCSHLVYFSSHTHCHTHNHSHLHSYLFAQLVSWLSFFDSDSRLIPPS